MAASGRTCLSCYIFTNSVLNLTKRSVERRKIANLLLYIMLATEHLRTVIMRIGDKSNIESKITKMRCPNPKYALKVLFQKTLHAVRIPLNLYIFFYFTPYKTLQWKKNE